MYGCGIIVQPILFKQFFQNIKRSSTRIIHVCTNSTFKCSQVKGRRKLLNGRKAHELGTASNDGLFGISLGNL